MELSGFASVVLTSAAVSAVVSGLFTFVSQLLERRARRRELLMKTATDLAVKHLEMGIDLAKATTNPEREFPALEMLAYYYHQQFSSLMHDGHLTPEAMKDYKAWEQIFARPYASREGP